MCDSDDDYFPDDLVHTFNEETLALLDEEESKFKGTQVRQSANTTQVRQTVGPPPKRQKTSGSWKPQPINNKTLRRTDSTLEDMDYLPDISVRQDGTYGLQDKQRRASGPGPPSQSGIAPSPSPHVVVQTAPWTRPTTTVPVSRGPMPAMRSTSGTGPVRVLQAPPRPPPSSARGPRATQSPVSSQEVVSRTQHGPGLFPGVNNRVSSTTVTAPPSGSVDRLLQQIDEVWCLCTA